MFFSRSVACVVGLALRVRHRWARIRIIRRKTATGWHHVRVARESQEKNYCFSFARLIHFVSSNILFYLVTEKRKSVQLPVLFVNICQSVLETILTTVYIQPDGSGTLLPQLLLFHLSTSRSTWSSMKLLKVKVGTVTSNKTHISVCIYQKCTNLPTTQMLWKRHPLLYAMCIGNHQLAHLGIC